MTQLETRFLDLFRAKKHLFSDLKIHALSRLKKIFGFRWFFCHKNWILLTIIRNMGQLSKYRLNISCFLVVIVFKMFPDTLFTLFLASWT